MDSTFIGPDDSVAIVLGAGATISDLTSHRASLNKKAASKLVLPPSDANFLETAERVLPAKYRKFRKAYLEYFKDNEVYPLDKQRMEQVFASIFLETAMKKGNTKEGRAAIALYESLVVLLRESLSETTKIAKPSQLHRLLKAVKGLEPANIDVVSFNYDMLCERALLHGSKDRLWSWRPGDGYGFKSNQPEPKDNKSDIKLHKLHGSMNWYIPIKGKKKTTEFDTKSNIYIPNPAPNINSPAWMKLQTCQGNDKKKKVFPLLVPPVFDKASRINGSLETVWSSAKSALYDADCVIFWGYSLPAADYHAELLFAQTARKKKYKCLVVNPDESALARVTRVAGHGWNRWFFDIEHLLR